MSFCRNCGAEISDKAVICPKCGVPIKDTKITSYSEDDSGSIGWGFLGFLFPIVGLVLFLVWRDTKPKCAKVASIGAIIRVIINIILVIIYIIFIVFTIKSILEYHPYSALKLFI